MPGLRIGEDRQDFERLCRWRGERKALGGCADVRTLRRAARFLRDGLRIPIKRENGGFPRGKAAIPGLTLYWPYIKNHYAPRSSVSTLCGVEFAVDKTDVVACTRICARVMFAVSAAKLVSTILLSADDTFS